MTQHTRGYLCAVATLLRECPHSREQAVVLVKHVPPLSEREWYELEAYDRKSFEDAGLEIRADKKEAS